ncbi:MAG: hypothetical protein ACI4P4_02460 [Faecousia sp.]
MKTKTQLLALLLAVMLLLCACGPDAYYEIEDQNTLSMTDIWRCAFWFHISPMEADHGEDAVIVWEDAGMEAHIRFLLDKPEGDIYRSDVWDIQVLVIQLTDENAHDIVLEQPADGWEEFNFESIFWNKDIWQNYDGRNFTPIKSLGDLRHFDSLQVLYLNLPEKGESLTSLSGLEECHHLKELEIYNAQPETLAPLSEISSLETLTLRNCGTLDLTPLDSLSSLSRITLDKSDILSLEPLTALPNLKALSIGTEASYPTLEPLTRTTVAYLDMGLSVDGRSMYDDLDYEPLTRIPNLIYLDLMNHTNVDFDLCETILKGNPELKYLDISYTPAAKKAMGLSSGNLEIFAHSP